MKKLLLISVLFCGIIGTACTKETKSMNKSIVVYFSCTGTTKSSAQKLATFVKADVQGIEAKEVYTDADLNWHDEKSRSSVEMKDASSRPQMANSIDLSKYDTIFIGYPIWWDEAPRIINTFIESSKLDGKTIYPFCTSGSSEITNSVQVLRKTYPSLNIKDGRRLNAFSEKDITTWMH